MQISCQPFKRQGKIEINFAKFLYVESKRRQAILGIAKQESGAKAPLFLFVLLLTEIKERNGNFPIFAPNTFLL